LNKLQFKEQKKTKKHALIINAIAVAVLMLVAIAVLLYGRVDITSTDATSVTVDEHSADPSAAQNNTADYDASLNNEQRAALRQKYIAMMNTYENKVKAQIEALNLAAWSPENITILQAQEQRAIRAFGENRLTEALNHLDDTFAKVSQLQLQQRQNFNTTFAEAQQAFATQQIMPATTAINNALRYLPKNSDALLLKERIGKMNAVAALVAKADVARIENNLSDEINLLDQAIKLDPYDTTLVTRHQLLVEKQQQLKLDDLLHRTSQALDKSNIKQAQTLLSQIKQIDATHPSLQPLTARATQIGKQLSYQNLVSKAETAGQDDDWQAAQNYYQQALQIFPDNADITKRVQLAMQINRYTDTIRQALERPERLADEQIALAMKQIAEDSNEAAVYSAQLRRLIGRLNTALAEMSTAVAVTVYSDGQTYVSVMGVGVIGKVREYQLKAGLKPGRYLFKGERKGYKDKLVEVYIKPRQATTVRVVCDEPI